MTEPNTTDVPIALAATVLLLREAGPVPEVLLMRRASGLVFHGGAWVFPGGRVDPADIIAGDELRSARLAAVREAHEEAGLALDPDGLVPVSHWTTPSGQPRRFATWFFAARLDRPCDVVVDGVEISEHRWMPAAQALSAQARGEIELPPPTFVTLSIARAFASAEQALDHWQRTAPLIYVPRQRPTARGLVSLYRGDIAYEGGEPERPGPRHRLHMADSGWRYERTLEVG